MYSWSMVGIVLKIELLFLVPIKCKMLTNYDKETGAELACIHVWALTGGRAYYSGAYIGRTCLFGLGSIEATAV